VDQYLFTLSFPSWQVEGQLSISHINDRQQTIVLEMWSLPITRTDAADVIYSFIHSFIFHFIHLQVQPKDVEIVIICCTMYLLNYRCHMTEYNYNTMIT